MPLLAKFFLGIFMLMGWLFFELSLRRSAGLFPSKFSQLRIYLDKKRAPRSEWVPFLFVFVSLIFFSFWEFLIFHMFGRGPEQHSWILALVVWTVALYLRKKETGRGHFALRFVDILVLALSWIVLFKSVLGLAFLLWLYLRSKFLRPVKG